MLTDYDMISGNLDNHLLFVTGRSSPELLESLGTHKLFVSFNPTVFYLILF